MSAPSLSVSCLACLEPSITSPNKTHIITRLKGSPPHFSRPSVANILRRLYVDEPPPPLLNPLRLSLIPLPYLRPLYLAFDGYGNVMTVTTPPSTHSIITLLPLLGCLPCTLPHCTSGSTRSRTSKQTPPPAQTACTEDSAATHEYARSRFWSLLNVLGCELCCGPRSRSGYQ